MTTFNYTPEKPILRSPANWKKLRFYQKADALFRLTSIFCSRFKASFGDRTVDQMVQAARSGKQNIIEGSEDGKTSTQMEINLMNVARSSIQELREDYVDHLHTRSLPMWDISHPRYQPMLKYCKEHNHFSDYEHYAEKLNEEEFCNLCYTLCCFIDSMMNNYLQKLEREFISEGGIKERMYAARTGYREAEKQHYQQLEQENLRLKNEIARLQGILRAHGIEG